MKTPKNYRLSQVALDRLAWLASHLKTTETSVVEMAITNLYMSVYYDLDKVRLAPPTPMCCRPLSERCPLETFTAAGFDITPEDCTGASCPHFRQ